MVGGSGLGVLDEALRTLKAAGTKPEDSFEIAFNLACAALCGSDLTAAQQYLRIADRRGQEMLTDEGATQEVRTSNRSRAACL